MAPMRIVFHLSTPMVFPKHPIHFDAILSALRVAAEVDENPDPWATQHDIPLDRYIAPDGEWVFKASLLRPVKRQNAPFLWTMTSRINLMSVAHHIGDGVLKYRTAKPNLAGGPLKSSIFNLHLQWINELECFAIGDIEKVKSLLEDLSYLGSRRNHGFGKVSKIDVIPCQDAEKKWHLRNMPRSTTLPLPYIMVKAMGALRVPYWKISMHKELLSSVEF